MMSVAIGAIQTRCATIAVFQLGMTPRPLNHNKRARPSTACGKKIGNRISFWNDRLKRHR